MKTLVAALALIAVPAFAAEPLHESVKAPDWVGTVLPGGKLERPPLCLRRGGVAHHAAYNMNGGPLDRKRHRDGISWLGRDRMGVIDWHRPSHTYLSFANRPFLVAAWCEKPRPARQNTIIVDENGDWHWADGNGP